jgi:hypothetical protein
LRTGSGQQFVKVGVPQTRVEIEFRGITIEELAVRLGDTDHLDVATPFDLVEETIRVAVRESGHGDSQGSRHVVSLRASSWNDHHRKQNEK